jgi:hypothetical protein
MMLKYIITKKKLIERKIKIFVISIFHHMLWKKQSFLNQHHLKNYSLWKKTHLNEINNKCFDELNEMDLQTTSTMPFITFLESISIDKNMYANALKVKL